MLYTFIGNDREKIKKSISLVQAKHKDEAKSLFQYDSVNWNISEVESLISNEALFGGHSVVILKHVFENDEAAIFVEEHLDEISKSESIVVLIEETLSKKLENKIEKKSELFERFVKKEGVVVRPFNIFSISDALGLRDRKRIWVLYQEALESGLSPEEIHPILFWQTKSMLAAENSTSPAESGLKPFVFTKSKKYAGNFSKRELVSLSRELLSVYSDSRTGKVEFGSALERFILSV